MPDRTTVTAVSDAPVPVGVQLGLGPQWTPSPTSWRFASVTAADGQKLHVVAFDTVAGTFGVAMTDDALRRFAQQCLQAGSGIEIARDLRLPGNGTRP